MANEASSLRDRRSGPRSGRVTILSNRWKGLRNAPHVPLTELPTPVEALPELSKWAGAELWVKRDDQTAVHYGGNKVRKLEYLLGEAFSHEADTLVTGGAAGSHHALAAAIFGAEQGLEVHVVSMPQRYSAHVEEQLRAVLAAGAEVHPVRSPALLLPALRAVAARQRMRGRRPYSIPPGGSNVAGTLGYVEAGLELARQMEAGVLPEPDALVVPLGSGGTAAGLAVGLAAAGITARVIGVRVVPRALVTHARLGALIGRTVHHLRTLDERFPDVASVARSHLDIDHAEYGSGYGEPTATGRNATRLALEMGGLELEQTYTAKAFAGALRHAAGPLRGGRILYVHTLSGADSSARRWTAARRSRARSRASSVAEAPRESTLRRDPSARPATRRIEEALPRRTRSGAPPRGKPRRPPPTTAGLFRDGKCARSRWIEAALRSTTLAASDLADPDNGDDSSGRKHRSRRPPDPAAWWSR